MGIGLGGFLDGILFHQILQFHNMLSNRLPRTTLANEEINMFWDGMFHAFCWIATVVALWLLWRCIVHHAIDGGIYFGALWLGWGVFNVVEGLIDHEILQLHHVYQNDPVHFLRWDLAFLLCGILFLLMGRWLIGRSTQT